MGNYLSQPICVKHSQLGLCSRDRFLFAACSMQGWRPSMEDAHLLFDDGEDLTIFGIYDGHGGADVSRYAAHQLIDELQALPAFKERNFAVALKAAYCHLDRRLQITNWLPALDAQTNSSQHSKEACFFAGKVYTDGLDDDLTSGCARFVHAAIECPRCSCPARPAAPSLSSQCDAPNQDSEGLLETDEPVAPGVYNVVSDLLKSVTRKFLRANDARHSPAKNRAMSSGCTALTVLIANNTLYVANAGDSRAVLCRNGVAEPLSFDHKPTNAEERLRVYSAGGYVECGRVNGNLNLSRALGDLVYKQDFNSPPEAQIISAMPDVKVVPLLPTDEFILIGCDGIWEFHSCQDTVDFVKAQLDEGDASPDEILAALFDKLISPNPSLFEYGCDNMSAIFIDLQPFRRCSCECHDAQRQAYAEFAGPQYVSGIERRDSHPDSDGKLAPPDDLVAAMTTGEDLDADLVVDDASSDPQPGKDKIQAATQPAKAVDSQIDCPVA